MQVSIKLSQKCMFVASAFLDDSTGLGFVLPPLDRKVSETSKTGVGGVALNAARVREKF